MPPIGVFPCGTSVGGTQDHSRSFKGNFGEHLSELREWGFSRAQCHLSPIEAIGVIEISRTIKPQYMLILTRQQLHLNFIQVYLQVGQSIFEDGPHQLIVFSSIGPVNVA